MHPQRITEPGVRSLLLMIMIIVPLFIDSARASSKLLPQSIIFILKQNKNENIAIEIRGSDKWSRVRRVIRVHECVSCVTRSVYCACGEYWFAAFEFPGENQVSPPLANEHAALHQSRARIMVWLSTTPTAKDINVWVKCYYTCTQRILYTTTYRMIRLPNWPVCQFVQSAWWMNAHARKITWFQAFRVSILNR